MSTTHPDGHAIERITPRRRAGSPDVRRRRTRHLARYVGVSTAAVSVAFVGAVALSEGGEDGGGAPPAQEQSSAGVAVGTESAGLARAQSAEVDRWVAVAAATNPSDLTRAQSAEAHRWIALAAADSSAQTRAQSAEADRWVALATQFEIGGR